MTTPETHTPTIWYLGSMNDGLFIINQPPRPSNDDVFPDRDGPTVALPVHRLTIKQAQAVCDAHNAIVACQAAALRGLLACYEEFQASSGNMEEAYYKLAKYAYPQWQAARAALSPEALTAVNSYSALQARVEELEEALKEAADKLEGLSHIHDGNPSDVLAGIEPVDYARHMLGEARQMARDAHRDARAALQGGSNG
jgi:hypothetical protein